MAGNQHIAFASGLLSFANCELIKASHQSNGTAFDPGLAFAQSQATGPPIRSNLYLDSSGAYCSNLDQLVGGVSMHARLSSLAPTTIVGCIRQHGAS